MLARIFGLGLALALAGSWSVAAQQPARSQWSGIYSDAQAKRGEPMYTAECAFCHGAELQGTFVAPPLTASALSSRWQNKTLADLFNYQQTQMPWTSPGGYGVQQNVDILAYILKKGGFPAGADLPAATDAQRDIRILAVKP
jgi:mono/diheme cytochrome c family protein